jgi:acetyl-CoA C-acetyltransferase
MIRPDSNVESIMRLKPSFPTPGVEEPVINAGTSTALTDGAAAAILMTEEEAQNRSIEPLAFILGFEDAKVLDYNEEGLLMAPAYAIPKLLKRHGLTHADIDVWELHEPFAAHFFCMDQVAGPFPMEKVNPNGGALAIGHPFGASGARYLYSTARELHRRSQELNRPTIGLIAVCANEGEGIAVLLKSA